MVTECFQLRHNLIVTGVAEFISTDFPDFLKRINNNEPCVFMISGTKGLLGAADGAFVMQKEKRTDNKAVLEVAGRDQQDQKLWLNFNRERCVRKLTKTETELWKEPEDPVLEKIKELVTETI